jgi:calcineurin-like phosphoesterase family protein
MFCPVLRSRLSTVSALLALAIAALSSSAARATDPAPRDWSKNPAIVELDKAEVIYAVGDPHADYGRLVDLFVKGDIIEAASRQPDQVANVKWKAGNAVLVCTGDMIDKGDNSVEVLQLFMRLQQIAPDSGGKVIVTMGNHEAEFLANPTNDKAIDFITQLRRLNIDPTMVANGTDSLGLGQFMRSLPFAARITDWVFSHAGNTNSNNPDKAERPRSLADLRRFLENDVTSNGYGAAALSARDSLLKAKLDSPWWQKAADSGKDSADRLGKYVKALGRQSSVVEQSCVVEHLAIGHQPGEYTFKGAAPRPEGVIVNRYDGLIFLIDCGMSSKINNSTGALLRIRFGTDIDSIRFEGNVRKEENLGSQIAVQYKDGSSAPHSMAIILPQRRDSF